MLDLASPLYAPTTCGTLAVAFSIAAGASPKEIATRAGHSSVVTVLDRYGHRLAAPGERVTDVLDALA